MKGAGLHAGPSVPGRPPSAGWAQRRTPVRSPSDADPPCFRPGSPHPRLRSLSVWLRRVTPPPVHTRSCLPAAQMKPTGGDWTRARKETEPHVLAVGRPLTRAQTSVPALPAVRLGHVTPPLRNWREKMGERSLPRGKFFPTAPEHLGSP